MALGVDAKGIHLGEQRVQTFSVKRFPDRAGFGLAARYLGDTASGTRGIRHNTLITLNLFFPDPEKTRVSLTTASQWAAHQTTGNLAHYAPRVAQAKRDFDVLFERLDNGDRPLLAYLGVVLVTPQAEAAAAGSNLRTYWRELGFQIMPDRFFALPLFLTLPALRRGPRGDRQELPLPDLERLPCGGAHAGVRRLEGHRHTGAEPGRALGPAHGVLTSSTRRPTTTP